METLVSGRRVHVDTFGSAPTSKRTPLLFIHGAGNDHTIWRGIGSYLTGRRMVAPDLPGHGKSDGPLLTTIGDMAGWTLDLAESLGLGRLVVVAHSMGCLVAMQTAVLAPQRLAGVALLAPAMRMKVHEDLLAGADRQDGSAVDLIVEWTHTGRIRSGERLNRRLLRHNERTLPVDLRATAAWDGFAAFVAAAVPTLVVVGEKDRMVPPREGAKVRDRLADAVIVEIDGGSHAAVYEQPDDVGDALSAWLEAFGDGGESRD